MSREIAKRTEAKNVSKCVPVTILATRDITIDNENVKQWLI